MLIPHRPTSYILVAILAVAALSTASQAQAPENDLGRENQRLLTQVRDLEATLKAALTRIAELEKSLASVNVIPGSSPGTTATPPPIGPSNLSPAGLTAAIRADFKVDLEASGLSELSESTTAEEQVRYTRWLKKWVAASNRQFRERVSWPVLIKGGSPISTNDMRVTFQPWDVKRSIELGKSFELTISTRAFNRATRTRVGVSDGGVARLDGVFIPEIRFNDQRLEVGPFDNPPFLGSMAELTWRFDFQGLAPGMTTVEKTPKAKPGTSP